MAAGITPVALRAGIVEETAELVYEPAEFVCESPVRTGYLTKEVGDGLWYVEAVKNYYDFTLPETAKGQLLTGYQGMALERGLAVPVLSPNGLLPVESGVDRSVLTIAALRVVDKLNPRTDGLWRGTDREAHTLPTVVGDYLAALACFAANEGIGLGDAVRATEHKLRRRVRSPHVITEDVRSSARERLVRAAPWVLDLCRDQAMAVELDYQSGRLSEQRVY